MDTTTRVNRAVERYARRAAAAGQKSLFDEDKHPRDQIGQFAEKPSSSATASGDSLHGNIKSFVDFKVSNKKLIHLKGPQSQRHLIKSLTRKNGSEAVFNPSNKQWTITTGSITDPAKLADDLVRLHGLGVVHIDDMEMDKPPEATTNSKSPLHEFHGESGMIGRVFKHKDGYSVTLHDSEADETLPSVRIFPESKLDEAKAHAKQIAGVNADQKVGGNPANFSSDFSKSFDDLFSKGGGMASVRLSDMRAALPSYSREEFNKELNNLRRSQQFTLEPHEGQRVQLTDADKEAKIREADQDFYFVRRKQKFNQASVPGMQRGLFSEETSGQKKLFDYVPPDNSKKKPSTAPAKSLLEDIEDDQKKQHHDSMSGQLTLTERVERAMKR